MSVSHVVTRLQPSDGDELSVPRFRIVGIGASAGGLESLEQLFANLPAEPGMAFVIIQHLSPDFRSMMDELLSRHSNMPIHVAEHEVEVQRNHVYLLPPKKEMVIRNRRLLLSDKQPSVGLTLPIDTFLRSLARDVGPDAVAIILSGSGSDGSRGILEVKRAGGIVIAETPESAKFDGMPLSALATGVVDYSATAAEIPRFVSLPRKEPSEPGSAGDADVDPDEPPMETVLRLLRDEFGIDFSVYKTSTVGRRIQRRVELSDSPDLESYLRRLRYDADERSALYHDMLIGVTCFFRDPEAFALIESQVIPPLLSRVPASEDVRIWVAGCATGEEAYSLAMLMFEQMTAAGRPLNLKILATDVHAASLAHANAGIYGEDQLANVSQERRQRFFTRRPNGYQISQDLRQLIVFAPHNIIKDAPFTRMQLVSCRNLLIYLEPQAQQAVLSLLHFGLSNGGVLFLGGSESPGALASEFDTIDEHWKLYRKRRDIRLVEPLRVPQRRIPPVPGASLFVGPKQVHAVDTQMLATYDQLLDRFMPPSFLVDEERRLLDSFGGAERLLRIGRRRPSTNLLDLLDPELRPVVAGAIQRVLKREGPVSYSGVALRHDQQVRRCTLSAEVIVHPRSGVSNVLVSFREEGEAPSTPAAPPAPESLPESREHLETLERELAYTRETLQAAVEELQTSNEELQSANEELVASNEELQSTNEELHSVNEELYTVNAEYQKKIAELREANTDMQHFLESSDVGTLFLDCRLRIRKYTPRMAAVFHIQPYDIGRSVRDFTCDLQRPGLMDEIEAALHHGTVIEDEVRDREGTTYFLRVLPYRTLAVPPEGEPADRERNTLSAVEGVVVSLTDITSLERARVRVEQLSAIVESSEDAILAKTLDGVITTWNRGAERLYGYSAEEVVGRDVHLLSPPGYEAQIDEFLVKVARGEPIEHVETVRRCKDGRLLDVSVTISPIRDHDGNIVGASAIGRDITAVKQAQRQLAEREARIRLLLEHTAEAILGLGPDGRCIFCNPACAQALGAATPDEIVGRHVHSLIHHSHPNGTPYAEDECPIYGSLHRGDSAHRDDEVLFRLDRSSFPAEYWSHPILDGGRIIGAVVTFFDITERKRADERIRTAARRREQFLAMLSHELRNPLAAVLSASQVMQAKGASGEVVNKARDVIRRQSEHMARLLDDLLDVSRITRGGISLRIEPVDLREACRLALEAVAPITEARQSQLVVELPDSPLPVRGDLVRLQQVVGNLLSNAARYSPPRSLIELRAGVEEGRVMLRVRDDGDGIEPGMLDEIFEMFVQADQKLDRSTGGLGIGLTLVRKIVELHDGTVEARSDGTGHGSEFVVSLPLFSAELGVPAKVAATPRSVSRRIVLVEDQTDARTMLRLLLERSGHSVIEAADGPSAIEVIRRERPDVAFVDIGLPLMDGYEMARRIRSEPTLGEVVLIALTGYGATTDIAAAYAAGFDHHLTKPADPGRIEAILAEGRRP